LEEIIFIWHWKLAVLRLWRLPNSFLT